MKTIHINRESLVNMFLSFNKDIAPTGATFANVIYKNDVDKSRTKNKKKMLQKITETRITLGADYAKKIRRIETQKQGADESNFEARKMNGKSYTNGIDNPVVHADKNPDFKMLVMIVENHVTPKNIYLHNGEVISFEDAKKQNMFQPSFFDPKPTAGRGAVEEKNDFHFLTLGFDKIVEITINKTKYIVLD